MSGKPYKTEEDRIREHVRRDLTPRQRLAHWWHYHWYFVALVLALAGLGAYFASSWGSAVPSDYSVAWVGPYYLDEETEAALCAALAEYGEDLNGDGRVVVRLRQAALDCAPLARGAPPASRSTPTCWRWTRT